MAVSSRRRVILMAWQAQGKSRPLTCAVFRVRVSMRPCPVSRVELPAGICRQGRALTRACSSGWLRLTVILSFCVSRGCDLRRPVVDSVLDGMAGA